MTPRVLFIGGTDSSGGAGVARDIATATRLGAEACLAVTAVTAQTDHGVTARLQVPAEQVVAQIRAAPPVGAVKIGMLGSAATVRAVAACLPAVDLVLDPVLASSSGHALLDEDGCDALRDHLLPRTSLLTPNLPELRVLMTRIGLPHGAPEQEGVAALMGLGCAAVLVKGGHLPFAAECEDRLYTTPDEVSRFSGPRFNVELRGTGCQLASAIAVGLAAKQDLNTSVAIARSIVEQRFRLSVS